MTERNLTIRLSVKDSEVVRRALESLGADGQKALERITGAAQAAGPGLEALNEFTAAGRGVMEDFAGRAGVVGGALSRLGAGGLVAATAIGAAMAALGVGLHEFAQAEQASLRLDAILKATGGTAGVTAAEIGDLADELEGSTVASAESIKEAAGALATFRSVSGEAFGRAITLSQDMAATFGGDVRSSVLQLGKALEDPANGLTALRRAGVTFTDAERDMIVAMHEAGDAAGAQKAILDALENQVGGAGAGEAGGLTGATKHLGDAWGNLLEEFAKTSGAGRDATAFLGWMTSLTQQATKAIAELPLEQKIAAAEARLAAAKAKADEPISPGLENGLLPRTELILRERNQAVAEAESELADLVAEKAQKLNEQGFAQLSARAHQEESAGEAQRARVAKLQEDVLKATNDAAVKRRSVEQQLTRDIAAEEAKRGNAGIDGAAIDQAVSLLRQKAALQLEAIDKPARETAERAAKQLADDEAKFQGIVSDLRRQALKVEDERAAFVDQAVNRIPEALKNREDIVATVRREAVEVYDLTHALKLLGEIEQESAQKRAGLEAEGKRLYESTRTAAEKHGDELERINALFDAGAITAETRARAITKADEEMAAAGKGAFDDLKQSIEGWGRSSARTIAQTVVYGKGELKSFGDYARAILAEIAEMMIYKNITSQIAGAGAGMFGGFSLFGDGGLFSGLFSSGGGAAPDLVGASNAGTNIAGMYYHGGGIVGDGADVRPVDPSWYVGAPRYHGGAGHQVPSLQPGEVPAVLLQEEEVLTASDWRHSRNGGGRMAFAPVFNMPITLNATTPSGTQAKVTSARHDSGGGFTIDLLVEQVEQRMGANIQRSQGLAPVIEDRYQLNPAFGNF